MLIALTPAGIACVRKHAARTGNRYLVHHCVSILENTPRHNITQLVLQTAENTIIMQPTGAAVALGLPGIRTTEEVILLHPRLSPSHSKGTPLIAGILTLPTEFIVQFPLVEGVNDRPQQSSCLSGKRLRAFLVTHPFTQGRKAGETVRQPPHARLACQKRGEGFVDCFSRCF